MQRKQVNTLDLVAMFTVQHLTLREIGRVVGMSAAGVSKRLRFAGIASLQGTWITRPCGYCGEPVSKPRSRGKRAEALYCGTECYYAARSNPAFVEWRQGSRLARAIVSQHFSLARGHVVHHLDGDQRHNDLANLVVYASQADHMAVHHAKHAGKAIEPIWRGDQTRG